MTKRAGIYLREGEEYVGPFRAREDAERFLYLMDLFGAGHEGIEIVRLGADEQLESVENAVLHRHGGFCEADSGRKQ